MNSGSSRLARYFEILLYMLTTFQFSVKFGRGMIKQKNNKRLHTEDIQTTQAKPHRFSRQPRMEVDAASIQISTRKERCACMSPPVLYLDTLADDV